MFKYLIKIPRNIAAGLVGVYQATVSPDHSWLKSRYPYGFCRHYPTCSEYGKQAILKFGILRGGYLSIKRIIKCNPWIQPSVDLIP